MTQTPDDPGRTPEEHDQDSEPASEPAGAAQHGGPDPEQDAGPASEPAGAAETDD